MNVTLTILQAVFVKEFEQKGFNSNSSCSIRVYLVSTVDIIYHFLAKIPV